MLNMLFGVCTWATIQAEKHIAAEVTGTSATGMYVVRETLDPEPGPA